MTGDGPAVLLVDDRPENLLALRAVLEPLNCDTVEVTSGEDALKALLQRDFAVVLLDVQMPGMDGFETAELIKGRQRTRAVPIIFVTAISKEPQHVFRGYEAGAVDYLFKPYDPELLRSKVRVFLELDAKTRAAARSEALLRAAFAHAPIGIARLDLEGRFAEVNRAFADLLGYTTAELRDRLLASVVHESDRVALGEGAAGSEQQARLVPAQGEPIPCLLVHSIADPGPGLPRALILQVQDLRERQRAELERDQRIREQIARAEAERASEMLRALQAISDAALGTLAFDQLVGDLLNRTADALGADTAAIALDEGDGTTVVHQIAGGEVGGTDRRWYSVMTASRAGEDARPPFAQQMASSLAVPLEAAGERVGDLHVGTLFARRFGDHERDLLRLAADRAAVAIQRARAHQRDRAIAEELQRSLLPAALPELRGAVTAARYYPGEAGERVGGDWYDAVRQDDDRLLLVIGDVAGHGIGAATEMGQLRSALRAYALDGHAPGALLERLNVFQIGMRVPGMTTVALVRVDLRAHEATYACAGHLPPLAVEDGGAQRWLEDALGPPLGAVDGMAYRERTVALAPGTTVVLYTDGLVEQRGETLDEGLARLRRALADPPEAMDALCDRIVERTLAIDPTEVDDDVTLLVLRTHGERRRRADRRAPGAPGDARSAAHQLASGTWPHHPVRSARVELPRTKRAAGAARRIVQDALAGALSAQELADVQVAVSEIVNNAVVHGGDSAGELVVVHLAATPDVLRAEISSGGAPFSPPEAPPVDEPGGFGLPIVEQLSSRWGLDFEHGVCVWLEMDRR
jgi:PAS domain S-box-containing protein